jgi:hypothetical protein
MSKKNKNESSLKWFKSTLLEQSENVRVKLSKGEQPSSFYSCTLINDIITVILLDGTIITKPSASVEDYEKILTTTNEIDIYKIVSDHSIKIDFINEKKVEEKNRNILRGIKVLKKYTEDFKFEGQSVVFKETSRTIPPLLVEKFIEVIGRCHVDKVNYKKDEEYLSLKRFFMWCCLNPRAEVAEQLYKFLTENSFRITKQGFFVALRNVVTISPSEDTEIVHFVSNAYQKIKAVWKKNPSDYVVIQENNQLYLDSIEKSQSKSSVVLGDLKTLYLELPNMKENRFTDAHTRSFDIRVGKVVSMPSEDCNWSTADCAHAGLHFTADHINYVGCGDTSVLILINPMKVVGIGSQKGRCYEYLPIMTVPTEESTTILHDISFDTLELDDQYALDQLELLSQKAQEGFVIETKKHNFKLPEISSNELHMLAKSLSKMKKEINNRINIID